MCLKSKIEFIKNIKTMGLWNTVNKVALDLYRNECAEAIEKSKQNYLAKLGAKLADNSTGQKTYWKIVINNLLNKCKVPRISPLLIADKFVISCKERLSFLTTFLLLNANYFGIQVYCQISTF